MKYRENIRSKMDIRAKIIIIASIIISFFVILLPLWQKGITRSNQYSILIAKERLEKLEEEEKSLVAYILDENGIVDGSELKVAGV